MSETPEPSRGRSSLKDHLLSLVVWCLFRGLRATWKLDESSLPDEIRERLAKKEPVVFAHWHEDEWALLGFYCTRPMSVLVSTSKDGNLMASFLGKLGFTVVRGSSSRRAVAGFLGLTRMLKQSAHPLVSFAVDGPRGPRRKVKMGVLMLARELKAPVVSGAAFASRAWIFRKAWSKAFVPKPFATIRLEYSRVLSAIEVTKCFENDELTPLAERLEMVMGEAKQRAKSRIVPAGSAE